MGAPSLAECVELIGVLLAEEQHGTRNLSPYHQRRARILEATLARLRAGEARGVDWVRCEDCVPCHTCLAATDESSSRRRIPPTEGPCTS